MPAVNLDSWRSDDSTKRSVSVDCLFCLRGRGATSETDKLTLPTACHQCRGLGHVTDQMPSYKLVVEYDGSRYNGFQRQTSSTASSSVRVPKRPHYDENGKRRKVVCTIQDCLEDTILRRMGLPSSISLSDLRMRCAGRTDAGVHARGQVVAFTLPKDDGIIFGDKNEKDQDQDTTFWKILRAFNTRLPVDIAVVAMERCADDFEPRFACRRKRYTYTIRYRRRVVVESDEGSTLLPICESGPYTLRRAFDGSCLWLCPWSLDDGGISSLCKAMEGNHNFAAFVHKEERLQKQQGHNMVLERFSFAITQVKTTTARASTTGATNDAAVVDAIFTLEAKGFARSMCRNLVGYMVDVARKQVEHHESILDGSEESASRVHSAPASGLCLEQVWFS